MQSSGWARAKKISFAALVVCTGTVFGSGLACVSFGAEAAVSSLDLCFLFDCQNGAFGGLVDPCTQGGFVQGRDVGLAQFEGPLLDDCPIQ